MSEPKTVWKGEGYVEPIRGQESSMFWASDQEASYVAVPDWDNVPFLCGRCGVCINHKKNGAWPVHCMNGHLNYRRKG